MTDRETARLTEAAEKLREKVFYIAVSVPRSRAKPGDGE